MKFPSHLNCDGEIVSEMVPWFTMEMSAQIIMKICALYTRRCFVSVSKYVFWMRFLQQWCSCLQLAFNSMKLEGRLHGLVCLLVKYPTGTSCSVCSTTCTVLYGFLPFLAQMITSMRGGVDRSKVKFAWAIWIFAVGALGIQVYYLFTIFSLFKFLQLIWKSNKLRWNLQVPDLQTRCSDLIERSWSQLWSQLWWTEKHTHGPLLLTRFNFNPNMDK